MGAKVPEGTSGTHAPNIRLHPAGQPFPSGQSPRRVPFLATEMFLAEERTPVFPLVKPCMVFPLFKYKKILPFAREGNKQPFTKDQE